MSNFDKAFTELLGLEGSYSNNPKDPGGETMWGITKAVAVSNGYTGAMIDLPQDFAKQIYAKRYWLPEFDQLHYGLAYNLFDAAVNHGLGQSVRWLQRVVGVADDGKFGIITLTATLAANPYKTLLSFNALRLDFFTRLSTWPTFSKGWSRRVVRNLQVGVGT